MPVHRPSLLLVCFSCIFTACTSDNSATVPPGGTVPTAGTALAKIVFNRVTGTTTPVGTYSIQEDGTGLITLLTGSAGPLLGQTPSGRLVLTDNDGAIVSVNPDGTGLVTLASYVASRNGPYYCGVTPNNRVVYRYELLGGTPPVDGNVYSRAVDGSGSEITLAGTSANELCHAVHPNGRVIVSEFTGTAGLNSARLYSVNEDGTGGPATLLDGNVRYAGIANGGRVIYAGAGATTGETIYSANPDGTGIVELQIEGSWYDGGLWVTPSGKVVYSYMFSDVDANIWYDLFVVNADGSGKQQLTSDTLGEDYLAEAPDSRIVFRCGDDLCSILPNGTGRQTLANAAGASVVMTTEANRVIYQYAANAIHSVNSDGTSPAPIVSVTYPANQVVLAGISSSGRVLYQLANGSFGTQDDLYSANADGTGTAPLATGNQNEWLVGVTVNDRVVFTRGDSTTQIDLFSILADGSGQQTLSATTDNDSYSGMFY